MEQFERFRFSVPTVPLVKAFLGTSVHRWVPNLPLANPGVAEIAVRASDYWGSDEGVNCEGK